MRAARALDEISTLRARHEQAKAKGKVGRVAGGRDGVNVVVYDCDLEIFDASLLPKETTPRGFTINVVAIPPGKFIDPTPPPCGVGLFDTVDYRHRYGLFGPPVPMPLLHDAPAPPPEYRKAPSAKAEVAAKPKQPISYDDAIASIEKQRAGRRAQDPSPHEWKPRRFREVLADIAITCGIDIAALTRNSP